MMATVVDEHLTSFVSDIGRLITGVLNAIEFVLGISYFCGQKLTEWVMISTLYLMELFGQISEIVMSIGSDLWEFGASIIRGFLLMYYGICMIFEAFYMLAVDLKSFTVHVALSVGQVLNATQEAVIQQTFNTFSSVPHHICEALIFVGERTVYFFVVLGEILKDFCTQLVFAPLNALYSVGSTIYQLVDNIVFICNEIPTQAQIGLTTLIILCTIYWKISIFSIVKKIPSVIRKIYQGICACITILKNSKRIGKEILTSGEMWRPSTSTADTKALCVICQDATVSFISMPCKHVCLCYSCVKTLVDMDNRCPLCRGNVTKFERVYIPL